MRREPLLLQRRLMLGPNLLPPPLSLWLSPSPW